MRSQIVTASNRSQIATTSKRNIRHRPLAFAEHGALMAANILNSPRAVAISVYVIRAFVKMREDLAANAAILSRIYAVETTDGHRWTRILRAENENSRLLRK